MGVKERVGDTGRALDGLEGDGLAALDQGANGGLGGLRLGLGLATGGLVEGVDAALTLLGHGYGFRWRVRSIDRGISVVVSASCR